MEKETKAAEDVLSEGKLKMKEGLEKAQRRIDEVLKDTRETASRSWEDAKNYCRYHPAEALGVALGVGAVLGILLTKALQRPRD